MSLNIYDAQGSEVQSLVNEIKPAGTYEITWNAASAAGRVSSGIYFYQIRAREFTAVKKMILLR